ncbi:hypothetical protein JB92DRAFT_2847055 [Gautieria morchelliformis]|nr:hypothetical protein JB92DRAFT_2847055 [Gautieria morchelliformis]
MSSRSLDYPPLLWLANAPNWRWLHQSTASRIFTQATPGTRLSALMVQPAPKNNCGLDGTDHSGTHGITTAVGNAHTIKFVTRCSISRTRSSRSTSTSPTFPAVSTARFTWPKWMQTVVSPRVLLQQSLNQVRNRH